MKRNYNWLSHLSNFVVVILGVYIAFYINERAKINQDRKESYVLLNSLAEDLSGDIDTYENYQIPLNKQNLEKVQNLLELLISDSVENIGNALLEAMQLQNYVPTSSTYSSMKSSGKLTLIEDLAIRKMLTNFYEGLVIESERKGEFQTDYFTDELIQWLTSNVDMIDMEILNEGNIVVLRNKLIIYQSFIEQKIDSYEKIVKESKKIKLKIEEITRS